MAQTAALGVPVDVVLDGWQALVEHTDDIAERFVRVFEAHLLPDGWRDGLDDERVRELATALARLRQRASQVLVAALDASMAAVARQRLADLVPPSS